MNIFYAPPAQIHESLIELRGQEAIHASKTLRYRKGDEIAVVDGVGGWYEGRVGQTSPEVMLIEINDVQQIPQKKSTITLAMGIIKKRDRLEFAVEKAVELGAGQILLFRGDHSVKQNIRTDRLEALAISAMKQSLQARLPKIGMFGSLQKMLEEFPDPQVIIAHKTGVKFSDVEMNNSTDLLLVLGPEGDFSDVEMQLLKKNPAQLVSLGPNRLRTETAAISLLARVQPKV